MIAILIALSAVGMLLIFAVYCIPTSNKMKNNTKDIAEYYRKEGTYPNWSGEFRSTREDYFTDATMLLIAIDEGTGSHFKDSLLNAYTVSPDSTLGREQSLALYIEGKNSNFQKVQYGRYWHGYLIWMKPLLYVISATTMRLLLACVDIVLLFYVLMLTCNKLGNHYALILLSTFIAMNPITIAMSFQFNTAYLMLMAAIIYIIKYYEKVERTEDAIYLFLIIGAATCYFDLLTYPLVTFGIPMAILLTLRKNSTSIKSLASTLGCGASWMFGYFGMWAAKWLIASAFTNYNMLSDAFAQASVRTSNIDIVTGKHMTFFNTVYNNIAVYVKIPYIFVFVLTILIITVRKRKENYKVNAIATIIYSIKCNKSYIGSLILISLAPFVWMATLLNHSYIHCFFTYRVLAITILCIFFIALSLIDTPHKVAST